MADDTLLTLTPLAVDKVREIMVEQGEEGSALRVLMVPQGASMQYMLSLEKEPTDGDITVEQGGLRILVDSESAPLLEGASIDYTEDLMRAGFVIMNPNFPSTGCACGGNCGCGGAH